MQHKAEVAVNASLNIHLDEHNCLEVIVIRGRGDKVHEIAGKLIATKDVQNGKLVHHAGNKALIFLSLGNTNFKIVLRLGEEQC